MKASKTQVDSVVRPTKHGFRVFSERLRGGHDERPETTRKRLTSTNRLTWLMLLVLARGFYAGLSVASGDP